MTLLKIDEHTSKLEEWTLKASWRSLSACCRAPRTCGASLARSTTAPAATVLPAGSRIRRKWLCWNRHNRTGFQLLTAGCGWKRKDGGPDRDRARQGEPGGRRRRA